MLTYSRGLWGEDPEIDDSILDETGDLTRSWVEPGAFIVEIFSIEENNKYPYAAKIEAIQDNDHEGHFDGLEMDICITDILSTFMLVKEFLPFIEHERQKISFDMKEEEHWWKAHDENRIKSKYKDHEKCCRHIG